VRNILFCSCGTSAFPFLIAMVPDTKIMHIQYYCKKKKKKKSNFRKKRKTELTGKDKETFNRVDLTNNLISLPFGLSPHSRDDVIILKP